MNYKFNWMLFGVIIGMLLFAPLIFLLQKTETEFNSLNVNYSELNDDESKIVDSILGEIRTEYFSKISHIYFTKNISHIYDKADESITGLNFNNGKIAILYVEDINNLKETICHELLHNIVETENEEFFVEDLDGFMSCYMMSWQFKKENHYIEKCEGCGLNYCQGLDTYGRGDGKCCKLIYSQEEYEDTDICWFASEVVNE